MRKIYFVPLAFSLAFFISSCGKMEYSSEFQKSREAWLDFKKEYNNTYRYEVTSASWTGFSTSTVISVDNGRVVRRQYVASESAYHSENQAPTKEIIEEWTEGESEIGKHTAGASAVTMDEVYREARNEWLKKRDNAKIYFETQNRGMISSCGYVPDGCQDDCFRGIHIGYIEPGIYDE